MDKYELIDKIGEGSYGKVFKARVKETGQIVALKKTCSQFHGEGVPSSSLREIANLKLLSRGENIVKLLAVETDGDDNEGGNVVLYMVFEYMDCDLRALYVRYLTNDATVPPVIIKNVMHQLIKGVEYCHRHGVIHRDLKPQNVLVNLDAGLVKVADMGLGRVLRKNYDCYSQEVATLWYRPPELLLGESDYNFAIDIWAVGCIFAELCNMHPFFDGDTYTEYHQIMKIFQTLGTPNEEVWPGVSQLKYWSSEFPKFRPRNLGDLVPSLDECGVDLLSKFFQINPSKRISARNALSHPYFFHLDDDNSN